MLYTVFAEFTMNVFQHPMRGAVTNQYFSSEDGTVKVPAIGTTLPDFQLLRQDIEEYKWNDEDFLLATYPKNGTHLAWEIMMMLLQGSAEYINDMKEACMIDLFSPFKAVEIFPSPRVLNTHYRLDVLPKDFREKKTVVVIRNPKDSAVSMYYHECKMLGDLPGLEEMGKLSFSEYLKMYLFSKDVPYGCYLDYTEYMWSLRDDPNTLVMYFEDMIMNPVQNIQKLNEFMGTQRNADLIQQISDAIKFQNMKTSKGTTSSASDNVAVQEKLQHIIDRRDQMYRKGKIGDWKNHLTVAENEMFDEVLGKWPLSKEIPFVYEVQ